eukprot:364552-Lingulodinium_polyedra.AAC.1
MALGVQPGLGLLFRPRPCARANNTWNAARPWPPVSGICLSGEETTCWSMQQDAAPPGLRAQ